MSPVVLVVRDNAAPVVRWPGSCSALVERATDKVCVCGKPIQPGQAYAEDGGVVRHFGC